MCACVCVASLSAFVSALGSHEMGRHELPIIIIIIIVVVVVVVVVVIYSLCYTQLRYCATPTPNFPTSPLFFFLMLHSLL